MTPRQLFALIKRELLEKRREAKMVGLLAAYVANFSFSPPKPLLTAEAVMGLPPQEQPVDDLPAEEGDGLLAALMHLPAGAAIQMETV
jgi:hypothetical protein